MQIIVRDNNVDQALRALKKKLQREGVYREMSFVVTMKSRLRSAPAKRLLLSVAPARWTASALNATVCGKHFRRFLLNFPR